MEAFFAWEHEHTSSTPTAKALPHAA